MTTIQYQNPGPGNATAVLDSVSLGTDYASQLESRRETVDVQDSVAPIRMLLMEIRAQNYAMMRQLSEIHGAGFVVVPEVPQFLAF